MITLHTFAAGFGEFSYSPFCTKAAYLLNMAGVEWQRHDMDDPRKMPFGKLPVMETADGALVADSDNIRIHLEAQGFDFDAGLSMQDRAVSRAFMRMAEEHIYYHQVHDRWMDDANWKVIRKEYFGFLPPVIRTLVPNKLRKDLRKTMHGLGLGRMTVQERLERVELDLRAIAVQLDGRPFLFGDAPSAADASIGAILGGIMATPVQTPLARRVSADPVLSAYVTRCETAMG